MHYIVDLIFTDKKPSSAEAELIINRIKHETHLPSKEAELAVVKISDYDLPLFEQGNRGIGYYHTRYREPNDVKLFSCMLDFLGFPNLFRCYPEYSLEDPFYVLPSLKQSNPDWLNEEDREVLKIIFPEFFIGKNLEYCSTCGHKLK